jgi:hypothetical protein
MSDPGGTVTGLGDWPEERLDAAYRGLFAGGAAPPGLFDATVERLRTGTSGPLAGWRRSSRGRGLALLGVVVLLILALLAAPLIGSRLAPDTGRFRGGGLSFAVPTGWKVRDASPIAFSGGSVIAIVGTLPVDASCGTEHVEINCYYQQRLEPGTISVVVGTAAYRGSTVFAAAEQAGGLITIAGSPGFMQVRSAPLENYYVADEYREWSFAMPGSVSNVYTIEASLRGPGLERMRADIDSLVASIRLDEPVVALPTGAAAEGAAAAVVASALDELDQSSRDYGSDFYGCFPREPGQTRPAVLESGPGGPLPGPVPVTCATRVEAAAGTFWELTLTVEWQAGGDHGPGSWAERYWLTADGRGAGRQLLTPEISLPETRPWPTPAPLSSPLVIAPMTSVEVVSSDQGFSVYFDRSAADSLTSIQPGARLVVVSGPVAEGGRDWYRVEWSPSREHPALFGWAYLEDAGRSLVRIAEPECPARPDVATLVALLPGERLSCYAGQQLVIGPARIRSETPDLEVEGEPGWLAEFSPLRLYGPEDWREGSVEVHAAPELAAAIPLDEWLQVELHLDDPAGLGCSRRFVGDHAEGLSPETPEEQELRCREAVLVTAFHPSSAP